MQPNHKAATTLRKHHGEAIPDWHESCLSERSIYILLSKSRPRLARYAAKLDNVVPRPSELIRAGFFFVSFLFIPEKK
ncbi:hypothetical protein CLV25_107139 [Acetobacteroides hydrogenigenes]|uniref:Uncharacterized protein n=1 Tax=Acetobacteroides hydrogenigenes TaxID=979970 RepID=A0A4V2RPH6_9BACT|nr:hypothetical protein CLV25_107139 [Acetobacteroides hydrogenigenes]